MTRHAFVSWWMLDLNGTGFKRLVILGSESRAGAKQNRGR
jgi:hypothetical protein